MGKRCIICNEEAGYKIKDTSDYYCQECAEENFNDLSLLVTMEEEAKRLKEYLKERIEELAASEKELEKKLSPNKEDNSYQEEDKDDVQNDTTGKD
jgi:hypothetical protein